jgi:hypothetical protein
VIQLHGKVTRSLDGCSKQQKQTNETEIKTTEGSELHQIKASNNKPSLHIQVLIGSPVIEELGLLV